MARKQATDLAQAPHWPQNVLYGGEHIKVIGRWHALVQSRTEPSEWYAVDLEPIEEAPGQFCTCRSADTRKACRHERVFREFCELA